MTDDLCVNVKISGFLSDNGFVSSDTDSQEVPYEEAPVGVWSESQLVPFLKRDFIKNK